MAEIVLVRHGQASFGAADYDVLSPLGERQARLLGSWLGRCGLAFEAVASGRMRRHRDTAGACLDALGVARPEVRLLDGLGEYDHDSVVARFRPDYADPAVLHADLARAEDPRRAFHAMYVQAVARWTGGDHDADYSEPWPAFRARVLGALDAMVAEVAAPGAERLLAFTSGGPITAICQHLLGLQDSAAFALNWPLVNAGITRLRVGAKGRVTLATFNAYPHLDEARDPSLVTFR